jgi:4-hydroxythreonine-4-phosphate dehydrogenase
MIPRIALTTGEPAGIGPDLVLSLAGQPSPAAEVVAIADPDMLRERARLLGLDVELVAFTPGAAPAPQPPGVLSVLPVHLAAPCTPGTLDPANAAYVLETLDRAVSGCQQGRFQAMVTAPVQKSVINDAGIVFTGHTEYLAERTGTPCVVMMLACAQMRVALVTTHLPLSGVPAAITAPLLTGVIEVLQAELQTRFSLPAPRIAVLGLNPHAGEGGHLGREEMEIIEPTLERLRQQGMNLMGPLPADTAFNPKVLENCDAVLAMYHDQGLPVLKYAGFGQAANITLGLPFVRTSVDHGTALDLAGGGQADPGSLHYALQCATEMARGRGQA